MNHLPILTLAIKSLINRRLTAGLTIFALAVSMMLVLGVEKVRTEAKASFANTISGTDLIVGARSGSIQLLLYSVFRIGNATNNISWNTYRHIATRPGVAWTVPLSLGDSHRGFRVLGTNGDYFRHYRYGRLPGNRSTTFSTPLSDGMWRRFWVTRWTTQWWCPMAWAVRGSGPIMKNHSVFPAFSQRQEPPLIARSM